MHDSFTVEGNHAYSERLAIFLAAVTLHSGDWLLALPISSCGLRLDDEFVRVAISIHLGINPCEPHVCHGCGSQVDTRVYIASYVNMPLATQQGTSLSMMPAGHLLLLASQPRRSHLAWSEAMANARMV